MPPPLKKKAGDKALPPLVPRWHPNFRNFERLPDTKVVRTAFFVNGVAVVVALSLLIYFCYQAYDLHNLRQQVTYWQGQIDANKPASDVAVRQFHEFQAEEKKIGELNAFLAAPLRLSDFIIHLGQTLPKTVALTSVDVRADHVILRGNLSGTPDQASGEASAYLDQLRTDADYGPKFEDVSLTSLNRNGQSGGLSFELDLKLKAPAKTGKKS